MEWRKYERELCVDDVIPLIALFLPVSMNIIDEYGKNVH